MCSIVQKAPLILSIEKDVSEKYVDLPVKLSVSVFPIKLSVLKKIFPIKLSVLKKLLQISAVRELSWKINLIEIFNESG